jgi:hypothetical protein
MRQELIRKLSIRTRNTRQELMRMLSIRISFPIFQTAVLSILSKNLKEVPSNHAEHARKELVRLLSIRVRN